VPSRAEERSDERKLVPTAEERSNKSSCQGQRSNIGQKPQILRGQRALHHEREEGFERLVPTAEERMNVHKVQNGEKSPRLMPTAEEQQRKLMPKAEERRDADVRAQA
jgi:hypothetical protein